MSSLLNLNLRLNLYKKIKKIFYITYQYYMIETFIYVFKPGSLYKIFVDKRLPSANKSTKL